MNSDRVLVDIRQVRDGVLDLRAATLRSIALCRDILDRIDGDDRAPEQERQPCG
jgi:hypothetical protein